MSTKNIRTILIYYTKIGITSLDLYLNIAIWEHSIFYPFSTCHASWAPAGLPVREANSYFECWLQDKASSYATDSVLNDHFLKIWVWWGACGCQDGGEFEV